jgi:hypothetical protein
VDGIGEHCLPLKSEKGEQCPQRRDFAPPRQERRPARAQALAVDGEDSRLGRRRELLCETLKAGGKGN